MPLEKMGLDGSAESLNIGERPWWFNEKDKKRHDPSGGFIKKTLDVGKFMAYWDGREAVQKKAAIPAGHNPLVKDGQDSPIRSVPDEPTKPLLESNDGGRELVFHERVAPFFLP